MITTTAMIKWGKVFGNYMVDHMAINEKLIDRGSRIIAELTDVSRAEGYEYLHKANKHVKEGIVMAQLGISYEEAKQRIEEHDGFIRFAFEDEED